MGLLALKVFGRGGGRAAMVGEGDAESGEREGN